MGSFVFGVLLIIGGIGALIYVFYPRLARNNSNKNHDKLYERLATAVKNMPIGKWHVVTDGKFKVRVVACTSDIYAVESENVRMAMHGTSFITCVAFNVNAKTGLRFVVVPVYASTLGDVCPDTMRLVESFKDTNYPATPMAEDAVLRLVEHLEEAAAQHKPI